MTLRVAERARRTWVSLEPRDFDAVADLVAAFIGNPESQIWGHLDLITQIEAGTYEIAVTRTGAVVALVETSTRPTR